MDILSLGEKVKQLRKKNNLTLKDLAGKRVTPGQISLIESGKSNPSMDLLEYLAEELNTTIEYLMETEETQVEKICKYYENIIESYLIVGDLIIAEKYMEQAIYYAEKYNLEYRIAKNYYLSASISMEKKDFSLAQQLLLSANSIFIKLNMNEEIVNTYLKLGIVTFNSKAYNSSCIYFEQASKVFENNEIGNDFLLGEIYYYLALVYFKLDKLDKSSNYAFIAKEKFKQLNEQQQYAKTLLLLSQDYMKKNDIDNAIKYSKKSLNVFRKINDYNYIAQIENDLGKLFFNFENIEESFIHYNIAKEIREKKNKGKLIETLANICENYIKLKQINKAKDTLDEIMNNIELVSDEDFLKYYFLKYRIDILENNVIEAEKTLLMALNYAENKKLNRDIGKISIMIGKFYMDNGKEVKAAKYLNKGVSEFEDYGLFKDL